MILVLMICCYCSETGSHHVLDEISDSLTLNFSNQNNQKVTKKTTFNGTKQLENFR